MDGNKTFLQHANIKHYKSATHQEGTFTNNTTRQWQDKTAETSDIQQFPLLKHAHTTVRQTDRQTDRQIKKPSANYCKTLLKRLLGPILRCSKLDYQKQLGKVKPSNYTTLKSESLPLL